MTIHGLTDMVVIQYGGRTVKGYAMRAQWPEEEDLFDALGTPIVHILGAAEPQPVPLDGAKAIFFVKSFDGTGEEDLRFHDDIPAAECLWVRATFDDGEIMEGLIANSHLHVVHDGFFLSPVDPDGNNLLAYIFKNRLADFQVLGLRAAPGGRAGLATLPAARPVAP